MKIPVFHDDQHGTAIVVAAAVQNAIHLTGKRIGDVKIVTSGAGAAAIACLNLLVFLGAKRENIWATDIEGVVYVGRPKLMDHWKGVYAQKTDKRTLSEVIEGADIFLGVSAPAVLKPEMAERMAERPLIMALANPTPEIMPEEALQARPDALICTGRSDYPNQVNNVLCFPYIFRGALDVGATKINEEMKLAAVDAIATLAREAPSDVAARAMGGEARTFGAGSLIPNPFDPWLILRIAPAVAKAAMQSGSSHPPDRRFRTVSGAAQWLRLPLGVHHEARVRPGEGNSDARDICRRRRRTHPACHPNCDRGRAGATEPGRPAGRHRNPSTALWSIDPTRPRFHADQP
jgi:malate dehydrogenase (oxaloacetate-decarboxylating)(NADP+)